MQGCEKVMQIAGMSEKLKHLELELKKIELNEVEKNWDIHTKDTSSMR